MRSEDEKYSDALAAGFSDRLAGLAYSGRDLRSGVLASQEQAAYWAGKRAIRSQGNVRARSVLRRVLCPECGRVHGDSVYARCPDCRNFVGPGY